MCECLRFFGCIFLSLVIVGVVVPVVKLRLVCSGDMSGLECVHCTVLIML